MAAPIWEHALFAWGANSHGQLGLKHTEDQLSPQQVPGFNIRVSHLSGGGAHSLIITDDHRLLSCGGNDRGQLGRTSDDHCPELKPVGGDLASAKVIKVAAGWDHSVAVTDAGQLYTWGSNAFGQLGHPCAKTSTPTLVDCIPSPVKDVACGLRHTVVLTVDGNVYTCGFARKGQLGLDSIIQNKKLPPKIEFFKKVTFPAGNNCMTKICAGSGHSVALSDGGSVLVWGDNRFGQLANDPSILPQSNSPVVIPPEMFGGQKVSDLNSGWTHLICQCVDGRMFTWGRCDYGQLGNAIPDSKVEHKPRILHLSDRSSVQLTCGSEHTMLLTGDVGSTSEVMTWGWNEHGMCGTGHEDNVMKPHHVTSLAEWKTYLIGCGDGHSMACCTKLNS